MRSDFSQMMYGCVTWSLRACHYDKLRRARHRFLTRCIGWRKKNRADHPISYLNTLTKTGSKSIEATLRRRRILYSRFEARMEDTRLPKYVVFGDIRAFGINADQRTTAAQDEWERRRTTEHGAGRFMEIWIAPEKARAGVRHAVVCPNSHVVNTGWILDISLCKNSIYQSLQVAVYCILYVYKWLCVQLRMDPTCQGFPLRCVS